ncbi:MAG: enoyl-CoA hydratase/isomerase family protein [Comamonadaceae bacterium]|nr:MAG: enoyl-CoA hydratase/isomerase family protein [Comamonadaceae bacterium]
MGAVRLERDGALARVVLSHPGKLNAMSRAMWRELRDVFVQLQADTDCRCIVLRGEGGAFCAGGDIAEYDAFRYQEATLRAFHEGDVWGGLQAVLDCDVPVVAAIEGACMGAGVEIASCCDLRLGAASAQFGAPIARLGFPMAPREAELVVRAAGEGTARQLLLQAAVLDGREMKARGFLQHLAEDGDFPAALQELVRQVAALAPQAARLNKRTLRALRERDDPQRRAAALDELAGAYRYAPAAEHREGIAAFLAKRKPTF